MDLLTILTLLIVISAVFSYLNERFIKLPGTIGVVTISVLMSVLILVGGRTNIGLTKTMQAMAHSIDFSKVLLDIMLGFLLFAGALHFDYRKLNEQRIPVFILSTLGVLVSAAIFGSLLYLACLLINTDLPLVYCFLFGALISPTDPIAVASILKKSKIPPRLHTIISGESLFNDGVGLVVFIVLLEIASQPGVSFSFLNILQLFAKEVIGGIAIGLIMGYIGYRMMKTATDFQTVFLISIALVLSISLLASKFHASIPLSAVTAGLIVGNKSLDQKQAANQLLKRLWQLVDEVLNTNLFVMIGLQLILLPFLDQYWLLGLICILIILIARIVSVLLPAIFLLHRIQANSLFILTWAGLRGGISVAMALSLPDSGYKEVILAGCYFVVIFSIIVQGLSLNKLIESTLRKTN